MSMEDKRRLLELLRYKPIYLDKDVDYRNKAFSLGYLNTSESNLKYLDFSGSVFYKCVIPQDEITQLNMIVCVDCSFYKDSESFLSEVKDLKRKVDFVNFDFKSFKSLDGINFQGMDLSGADFRNMNLDSVSFEDCTLTSANFRGAMLVNCNFRNADLSEADFINIEGDPSQLENAYVLPEGLYLCEGCDIIYDRYAMHTEELCYNCNDAFTESLTCERCGEIDLDGLSDDDLCSSCEDDEDDDESED